MADLNEELFDVRVVERNIRQGHITRDDYENYLSAMGDEADESADTETLMESFLTKSSTPEGGAESGSPSE